MLLRNSNVFDINNPNAHMFRQCLVLLRDAASALTSLIGYK